MCVYVCVCVWLTQAPHTPVLRKQWWHANSDDMQTVMARKHWWHANCDGTQTVMTRKQWWHANSDDMQTVITRKQWWHAKGAKPQRECVQVWSLHPWFSLADAAVIYLTFAAAASSNRAAMAAAKKGGLRGALAAFNGVLQVCVVCSHVCVVCVVCVCVCCIFKCSVKQGSGAHQT